MTPIQFDSVLQKCYDFCILREAERPSEEKGMYLPGLSTGEPILSNRENGFFLFFNKEKRDTKTKLWHGHLNIIREGIIIEPGDNG